MTMQLNKHSKISIAAILAAAVIVPTFASDAIARPKCERGAVVQFLKKTRLTWSGELMCTVFKDDLGGAKKLGASKKSCLIESYGVCSGPRDEGWAKLDSFKRIR